MNFTAPLSGLINWQQIQDPKKVVNIYVYAEGAFNLFTLNSKASISKMETPATVQQRKAKNKK